MEVFAEFLANIDNPQHRERTEAGVDHFSDEIVQAGYDHTKQLVRIKWDSPVDYSLLEKMIEYNIFDKADCSTFWRK